MKKIYTLILITILFFACSKNIQTELDEWLATPEENRINLEQLKFANQALTLRDAEEAQKKILANYESNLAAQLKDEWEARKFTMGEYSMKFHYDVYKLESQNDRSLFISMHGGGGVAAEVNEQQWKNQWTLYKPAEGVYLSPRSSTNTWNMWHQSHVDAFFDRIIQAAVLFENVNPNKVYVLGYSAGGDGAYQIAPRMADRWAAAAMMAGHPGDASPVNLRNLPFDLWMGELDSAYNRNTLMPQWAQKLEELHQQDKDGYIYRATLVKDRAHWMYRADTASIEWMMKYTRNPYPKKVAWQQDDVFQNQMYWVEMSEKQQFKGAKIIASIQANTITIDETNISEVSFYLNDKMLNLDQAVKIVYKNKTIYNDIVPRTILSIYQSITNRYDPEKIFTAKLRVNLEGQ